MSSLTMRLARPADKEAVTAIALAINPHDYVPELFDEFVREDRFWVAEQAGQIVGCHAHSLYFPGQMYLFAMRIRPDIQGRGIGSAYCHAQVELGRQMGMRELWLISEVRNARAHRTVMKNGFVNRGEWVLQEALPLAMLPAEPAQGRARAGRPGDLPLLAPLRSLPLGDVLPAGGDQYHLGTARDTDWALSELVVVDAGDGDGGLAGAMLLRETDWGELYIRRLEGTPEAAADLLAYARAEGARRGKQDWVYSLPARAEHLLAPTHVDPAKSFRTYAFQYIMQ